MKWKLCSPRKDHAGVMKTGPLAGRRRHRNGLGLGGARGHRTRYRLDGSHGVGQPRSELIVAALGSEIVRCRRQGRVNSVRRNAGIAIDQQRGKTADVGG